MRWIYLALFLVLFAAGCAPKMTDGTTGDLRKKLYYDANLAFSIAVPEDWERKFISPPRQSPARYAVHWQGDIESRQSRLAEMNVALLAGADRDAMLRTSLADFAEAHPGFEVTVQNELDDQTDSPPDILGRSSSRQYRIVHIPAPGGSYRIDFSTPKDDFSTYQPLFDLILGSFQQLD